MSALSPAPTGVPPTFAPTFPPASPASGRPRQNAIRWVASQLGVPYDLALLCLCIFFLVYGTVAFAYAR